MGNPHTQNKLLTTFLKLSLELEEEPVYPLSQAQLTKIETLLLQRLSQGDIHERQILFIRLLCGFENNGNPRSLRKTQQHPENKWRYSKKRINDFLAGIENHPTPRGGIFRFYPPKSISIHLLTIVLVCILNNFFDFFLFSCLYVKFCL